MISALVNGCERSCSFRLQVITSRRQASTAPMVYPSDILAMALVSKLEIPPEYSLQSIGIKHNHRVSHIEYSLEQRFPGVRHGAIIWAWNVYKPIVHRLQ